MAVRETMLNSALPVDELRDLVTSALLGVASSTHIPPGRLGSDSSITIVPHIDTSRIFSFMKDIGKVSDYLSVIGPSRTPSDSETITVRIYQHGKTADSSSSPSPSEEMLKLYDYLATPHVHLPLEGWCDIVAAALANQQQLLIPPILEHLRWMGSAHAALLASEALLAGEFHAKARLHKR